MPNDDAGKYIFWNSVNLERLNKRQYGIFKDAALKRAFLIPCFITLRLVIRMSDTWSNTTPKDKYLQPLWFSYENSNCKIHPKE
jgi:hypothetical protein